MTNPGELLRQAGDTLDAGLIDDEIEEVESRFGFRFLPEHRAFLQEHLSTGRGWPSWRSGDPDHFRELLSWPVTGMLLHVEDGGFWPRTWGTRPRDRREALAVARHHLAAAPKLVPVYGHRYLPAAPAPSSAPVFSVYQSDVIYYGDDLADYLDHEFGITKAWEPRPTVRIPFWSDLAEGADV